MLWTKALEAMETAVEIVTRTLRGATQPPLQFALMVCATTLLYPRRSAQCDAKKNAVRPLVRHAMALIPSHPFVGSAGDRAADFHICSVALALLNTMCFKDGFAMTHASGQGLIVVAVALRHVAVFLAECDEAARRHGEDIAKHTDGILRSYQYHFARRASEDVDVHSLQDWTGVAIAELPSQHLTNDAAVKFVHDYCTQRKDDWTVLFPSAAVKCLHFALQQIGHASRHLPADELGNLVPRWIDAGRAGRVDAMAGPHPRVVERTTVRRWWRPRACNMRSAVTRRDCVLGCCGCGELLRRQPCRSRGQRRLGLERFPARVRPERGLGPS
jgi:hypothetical protein